MKFPVSHVLFLATAVVPSFGSDCQSFVDSINTGFAATNPDLLSWECSESCTSAQKYEVYYIKGKTAFYLENYTLSQSYLDSALAITGKDDEDILMFLNEIGDKTGDSSLTSETSDRLSDRMPSAVAGYSDSEKGKQFRYTGKAVSTNQISHSPLLVYNSLTGSLLQSRNELKFKESATVQLQSNPNSSFVEYVQGTFDFQVIFRKLLCSAGYGISYTNDSTQAVEARSGYVLVNHDWEIGSAWTLTHSVFSYLVNPQWFLIDLTEEHAFTLNDHHEIDVSFSYEKDFIAYSSQSREISELDGSISLNPQISWIYSGRKNRLKIASDYLWERENYAVIPQTHYDQFLLALDNGKTPLRKSENQITHTIQGYGSYRHYITPKIYFEPRIGGGSELVSKKWYPFYLGRLDMTVSW